MAYSLRQKVGAAVIDWPRFEIGLHRSWTRIRNRHERLIESPSGRGVACQWRWTSDLHVAKVFPSLGKRLMTRALADWPISFADAPGRPEGNVRVSFVIGHRGMQRARHLLATLAAIAAQRGPRCECIVVEQSMDAEVRPLLPAWVRYVHTPLPKPDMPYCRSWALNVGARVAEGKVLVLHDNDMLVPEGCAAELWNRCTEGYEVINLKRFIFYLTERHSHDVASGLRLGIVQTPEVIMQNAEAGGSIALTREAFFAIGGYDESFVGWGGEDNEFWERAQTRRVWPYGYLPLVHLWHPAQPRKQDPANPNARRQVERSAIPTEQRIRELAARPFGNPERLSVDWPESRTT
jgi:hypothetical protein